MPLFLKFTKLRRTKRRRRRNSSSSSCKQMNYDGLLSQLTEDKLAIFETSGAAGHHLVDGAVQDGAIEEEQAAPIQTIPHHTAIAAAAAVAASAGSQNAKLETTPQRKISTSSRFMNAFSQLYGGSNNNSHSNCGHVEQHNEDADLAANRTPTKGMESKLVAMWHNVKYGWSGKMRQTSFSKEQPVWLLGRCYHRRFTPPVSMENSVTELPSGADATPDNATSAYDSEQATSTTTVPSSSSALYPTLNPQQIDEIVVPQELGMDAAENQLAESPWEEGIEGFRRDFYSRIWMTYRREFPTMNGSNYTSDCGWGCMLRSGQMLLAQGLICHFLGRSWRYDSDSQLHSTYEDNMHKKIIKWFGDSSSKSSPFSIHALVRLGEQLGKKPGDWYGPASVSYLLKHALELAAQENADFDNICVYVAKDCTIYMQDVEELCSIPEPAPKPNVPWQQSKRCNSANNKPDQQQHWKSLIVLIPLRLGTDKLNPVYAHCLKLLLSTEHCLGIIGGKPKHSLYFVGFQEDKLIHLDPHYCQEMVDVNQETFSMHSFHCKSPRKLKSSKMDPSCCIGFYCATKTDFDSFVESVQLYLHPMRCASGATMDKTNLPQWQHQQQQQQQLQQQQQPQQADCIEMNYPLFTFSRGRCMDHARDEMSDSLYKPLIKQVATLTQELEGSTLPPLNSYEHDPDDSESEEFVLL
ncbi:LOW QUALITY PROTEIN: cysteine protease ATG4D [Drosophila sulfurigaster albostrigata]|uniref:LOW QUALITY PROTEIN: cysteine protease ATG4D n=1 Tax=Drosophila sulfurigaster albostrigata TaxID=89887 RepID=UPI002D2198E9|nr:LOW QUALITY PROTEIN: cysteine protease ATG4D [Drosophila sulfurigaster albostrigata]